MLSLRTIVPDTLELLKRLSREPFLKECRLVGGTALALQYGHRSSIDLDFFGSFDMDGEEMLEALKSYGNVEKQKLSTNIRIFDINGIKVDIVNYSIYPWLEDSIEEDGLRLASPKDIAAMKLSAVANRGRKKDFIDVAKLLDVFSLDEMLALYKQKFSVSEVSFPLRGLMYFDDAEDDPMPEMFDGNLTWDSVKKKIIDTTRAFILKEKE